MARMRTVMNDAVESLDYVIIDLPPVGKVADVCSVIPMFRLFVFIVE